jgi:hypothetical protein
VSNRGQVQLRLGIKALPLFGHCQAPLERCKPSLIVRPTPSMPGDKRESLSAFFSRSRAPTFSVILSRPQITGSVGLCIKSLCLEWVTGAPRSMKMGTILSPWHYDAGARHAFQSAKLRRPAMLHYALVSGGLPGVTGRPASDFATSRAHWMNSCTTGPRVLFLSVTTATGGRTDNSIGSSLSEWSLR